MREELYVVLGGVVNGTEQAVFRFTINPLVWWVWYGGVVLVLGGLVGMWPGGGWPGGKRGGGGGGGGRGGGEWGGGVSAARFSGCGRGSSLPPRSAPHAAPPAPTPLPG